MPLQHLDGSYDDALDARVELLEAKFETKSAYIANVSNSNIEILGLSVPTAAWAGTVTSAVNGLKDCLVDRGLMEQSA